MCACTDIMQRDLCRFCMDLPRSAAAKDDAVFVFRATTRVQPCVKVTYLYTTLRKPLRLEHDAHNHHSAADEPLV